MQGNLCNVVIYYSVMQKPHLILRIHLYTYTSPIHKEEVYLELGRYETLFGETFHSSGVNRENKFVYTVRK